jgi:sensor histidine kinase YesM
MKYKQAPYIVIAVLCLVMGIARYNIIEEWPLYFHILVFFFQFILLSGIWNLIRYINSSLKRRFNYTEKPVQTIFLQVFISLLLVSPIFIVSFYFARPYLPSYVSGQYLTLLYVLAYFVLLLLNFGFFAHRFFMDLRTSLEEKNHLKLEAEKLAKEKMMMQYHHLKNQVNPHFLFNTLTSLDGLVHSNPDLASEFIKHLSKVYRYVLEHKENEVVRLQTELEFIEHYIQLLKIRYGKALEIVVEISEVAREKGIAMVTLQMLIDNAIKHNTVGADQPLYITILDEGDYLIVKNRKQIRKQIELSTKQGLQQLRDLYGYLTSVPVEVIEVNQYFKVKLPLL